MLDMPWKDKKKGDTRMDTTPSVSGNVRLLSINHGVPLHGPEGLILFSDGTQRN